MEVREIGAGAMAAVVTLAGVLTLGLLAYASLGATATQIGLPAAFIGVALGGLTVALVARSAMPTAGLSSATTLIFASAVAQFASDSQIRLNDPSDLAAVIAAASACLLAMGFLQMLFAWMRLGDVAKFVPQPVLAGFMSAVAIVIVLAQIPLLLGAAFSATGNVPPLTSGVLASLAVGLGTAAVTWLIGWKTPRAPAALLGLLAGGLLYAAIKFGIPDAALGPLVGNIPAQLPAPDAMLPLLGNAAGLLERHAGTVLLTGLLLAIIGSLESILSALATDQQVNARHDPNRELFAYGVGNAVSAVFGGVPLVYSRSRARAALQAGGKTPRAAVAAALATGVVFIAAGPLLALLPLAVLAGVMLTVAVSLIDSWTRQLVTQFAKGDRSHELKTSLALVAAVCSVTLWLGFVAGVALGVLLSMVLFIQAMNRSLIRTRFNAAANPSRRIYLPEQENLLRVMRERIEVLELEGALFFGSVERLATEAEKIAPHCRFLLLDLKRVSTIDPSGAVTLQNLSERLARNNVHLYLAGVSATSPHGRALRALGTFRDATRDDWYPDTDHAIEAAEQRLLSESGAAEPNLAVALEHCALLQGLDGQQLDRIRSALVEHRPARGSYLFREGEPGDCLYVLTAGSISMVSRDTVEGPLRQRYVSFSAGMMFGEAAMLDREGRTADAVADSDAVVHELSRAALDRLRASDAALAARLYANIATHLSQRLRGAAAAWRSQAR